MGSGLCSSAEVKDSANADDLNSNRLSIGCPSTGPKPWDLDILTVYPIMYRQGSLESP